MSGDYFSDIQTISDIGLAQTLAYLGYEVTKIVRTETGRLEFYIVIPKNELEDLLRDYKNGTLQLSDIRSFCRAQSVLLLKMKQARIDGEWRDGELAVLAKQQGITI
jgi:hypothetical protein